MNLWGWGGGWHLPDFETDANRDSRSTFEDFFPWLVYSQSGTREYFPALAGLVGPGQENIFLPLLV